ncbi:hypothetical protein LG298_24205 [Cytobacillus firmus]|uniref:hypothetical protein n=1 Tax=Cytobacillus firmus TaxID=1399 RepID=UPI00384F0915
MGNGKWEIPDTYVILFAVLLMAVVATYFVPAGAFEREIVDKAERVLPGTYAETEGNLSGFMAYSSHFRKEWFNLKD